MNFAHWIETGKPRISPARIGVTGPAAIRAIEAAGMEGLLPAWTYHECFRAAAALAPDKAANILIPDAAAFDKSRTFSFSEMLVRIEQAANLFRSLTELRPPVVSILAPLVPEALIAMWGAAIAGIANPINPFLEPSHIAGIMNAAHADILVSASPAYGPGAWQRVSALADQVKSLRAVLVIDDSGDQDFLTRIEQQPQHLAFAPNSSPDRVSAYFHTGGTTAAPKLVQHTQRGQLLNAWNSAALMGPEQDEIVGHGMPNFHVGGAILFALRSLIMGQTLLTLSPNGFRDPAVVRGFWDIARHYRMTSVGCAPTSAAMILADPSADSSGHSIRTFTVGGGAMPRSLGRAFEERFGLPLREIWGMTECQGILSSNPWGRGGAKNRLSRAPHALPPCQGRGSGGWGLQALARARRKGRSGRFRTLPDAGLSRPQGDAAIPYGNSGRRDLGELGRSRDDRIPMATYG